MRTLAMLLVASLVPACLADDAAEDGENDDFTGADGKADGYNLSAAEEAGVLELVNTASLSLLDNDVPLSSRAAKNITTHRAGADKKLGTADDNKFDTLVELDKVSYVGPTAFAALLKYAKAHGYVHDTGTFCKTQHAGKTPGGANVQICDALYDSAPYVHLPADQASASTVTAHGVILNGPVSLYTADGRQLPLVTSSGDPYKVKYPDNLFTVVAVTGTKTTSNGTDAIKVTSVTPLAWVPGTLQDKALLGTWEAKVASRKPDGKFDQTKPVMIRFTMTTTKDDSPMWQSFGGGVGDGVIVSGTIDNMKANVTAADGTCMPSLASLGATSPFYQATDARLTLWRHPNMHGINDQVIVMDYPTASADLSQNGMGWIGPFTVAGLVRTDGPNYAEGFIYPHATPNGHEVWQFAKVTAGGGACN
jgi:hypothetical protein